MQIYKYSHMGNTSHLLGSGSISSDASRCSNLAVRSRDSFSKRGIARLKRCLHISCTVIILV